MKFLLAPLAIVLLGIGSVAASIAMAAPSSAAHPTIIITSPANGAVIHGNTITVTVAVSNFKLVTPRLKNPPVLKGNQGHIHYVLDGTTSPDITAATSQTWTVTPGRHTVVAYLATSLHLPFPHVKHAQVTVTVKSATTPPTPHPGHPAGGSTSPGVGVAPTTGGAASSSRRNTPPPPTGFNVYLLLAGLAALVVGLFFLGRRYAFAATGVTTQVPTPARPRPASVVDAERRLSAISTSTQEPVVELPSTVAFQDASSPLPSELPAQPTPESRQESAEGSPSVPEPARSVPLTPPQPAEPQQTDPVAPVWDAARWDTPAMRSAEEVTQSPAPRWDYPPPQPSPIPPVPDRQVRLDTTPVEVTRSRAIDMAHQWSSVVEDLVHQLERQEAERTQMLARLAELEDAVQAHDSLRQLLIDAGDQPISREDLQAVQYVTDSLVQDPDHIVVLASVAQHADRLARVVKNYARIQKALGES